MSKKTFINILIVLLSGFFVYSFYQLNKRVSTLELLLQSDKRKSKITINTDNNPYIGHIDAHIEVAVFSDFTCPHCKELYLQIERLRPTYIDTKKVKFFFFSYPMLAHENSLLLSSAGKYGQATNQFEAFYHRLFQRSDSLSLNNISENFTDLVADTSDFISRVTQPSQPAIEEDIKLIREYQIKGAPAFIINGELHVGLKSDEKMKAAIEAALQQNQ